MRWITSDLLLLTLGARLHDSHQVSMLPLLLGLRAPSSRGGHIDAILGHDGEARQSELGILLALLLRLLRDSGSPCAGWRGQATERPVSRIGKGRRRSWAGSEHGWREARRLRLSWALLERLRCPWEDLVGADEGASIEIDGGIVVKVDSDLGEFVLLGRVTNDIDVNQFLEFFRTESWDKLQRSTQERLGDGERGVWVSGSLTLKSAYIFEISILLYLAEKATTRSEAVTTYHCD